MERPQEKKPIFVTPEEAGVGKYVIPKKGGVLSEVFSEIPEDVVPTYWEVVGIAVDPSTKAAHTNEIVGSGGKVSSVVEIRPRFYLLPEKFRKAPTKSSELEKWEEDLENLKRLRFSMETKAWRIHVDDLEKLGDETVSKSERLKLLKEGEGQVCNLRLNGEKEHSKYKIKEIISSEDEIFYILHPLQEILDELEDGEKGDEYVDSDDEDIVITEDQFFSAQYTSATEGWD